MTIGSNQRSCLTFAFSAIVAVIGLQTHISQKPEGQMKSIFIWCMVWVRSFNMTIVPMSHDQNVFRAMLDKNYSKLFVSQSNHI